MGPEKSFQSFEKLMLINNNNESNNSNNNGSNNDNKHKKHCCRLHAKRNKRKRPLHTCK